MTEVSTKIGASKKTPIVTLETNFKSLRYKDYSNGKEPLVTKDINKYSSTKNQHGWYRQYAQGTLSEVTNRADDITRITKWVATPRGVLWEARQAALENLQTSLTAKRQEGKANSGSFLGNILKKVGGTIVSSAELTASTLAQVAASETGYRVETFLSRAYLSAGSKNGVLSEILDIFRLGKGSENSKFSGARQILGGQNVPIDNRKWDENTDFSLKHKTVPTDGNYTSERYVVASRHEIDKSSNQSGQKSVAPVTVGKPKNTYSENKRYFSKKGVGEDGKMVNVQSDQILLDTKWSSEKKIKVEKEITGTYYTPGTGLESKADQKIGNKYSKKSQYYPNVERVEKALGNQEHGLDRPTRSETLKEDTENGSGQNLVPFIFGLYAKSPIYFEFEATLESLSDKYTGNWNGTQYIGRPEQFYTYQGFTRSISFSFIAVAKHPDDLQPLYHKLNRLASATAPVYGEGEYFMQGIIGEVTIGDYLQHQKGYFGSINLDWETDYMWDLGGTGSLTGGIMVPMALKVSVEFTPIHEFNVQNLNKGYFAFRYREQLDRNQPKVEKVDSRPELVKKVNQAKIPSLIEDPNIKFMPDTPRTEVIHPMSRPKEFYEIKEDITPEMQDNINKILHRN